MNDAGLLRLIRDLDLVPDNEVTAVRLERDSERPCRACGRRRRVLGLVLCAACWNAAASEKAPARRPHAQQFTGANT